MFSKVGAAINRVLKVAVVIFGACVLLLGLVLYTLNPWKNDDYASRKQLMKYCEGYLSYYTQEMWDGTIQTVIFTDDEGPKTVEAINGEFPSNVGKVLASDFKQPKQEYGRGLIMELENIEFCGANGCTTIASCSSAKPVVNLPAIKDKA